MTLPRWNPPVTLSAREARIRKRVGKKRRLFGFLCDHRRELFDEDFQAELEQMYRDTGAGKDPVPPALLAMAVLLQGYAKASDSDAVELAACDARWQLVLGCLGTKPPSTIERRGRSSAPAATPSNTASANSNTRQRGSSSW